MKRTVFILLALFLAACGDSDTQPAIPQAPTINSFTASPPTIAAAGDAATLNWSISGSYDTLQLTDSTSTNVLNVSGTSFTVNPMTTTTYRLTATKDGESASSETKVTLTETDTPPTDPTDPDPPTNPAPAKPTINSFDASPQTIQLGDSVILKWNVSGADSLRIDNGVGTVSGTTITVTPDETTTYTLTATNGGGNDTKTAVVTVASEPEPMDNFIGRWLITFNGGSDGTTYVHELDIDTVLDEPGRQGGTGKHLLCHQGLRGPLCSTFDEADGSGYIAYVTGLNGNVRLFIELAGGDLGYVLSTEDLSITFAPNGRQILNGDAEYYQPGEAEEIYGTVEAVNVGKPRKLK